MVLNFYRNNLHPSIGNEIFIELSDLSGKNNLEKDYRSKYQSNNVEGKRLGRGASPDPMKLSGASPDIEEPSRQSDIYKFDTASGNDENNDDANYENKKYNNTNKFYQQKSSDEELISH